MEKCKNCGVSIVRFPLKDSEGKILWKNLFKMSWDSIILVLIIIAMITAYKHDIGKCNEVMEDPIGFCDRSNACYILANELYRDPAGVRIFDLDIINATKNK